jgi:hypothetical protein
MIATALIAAVNGKHFLFPVSRAPILEVVGLNTISVFVILGANVFLFIFIPRLSAFERHQNKSQLEETIMLRLYFFQVFNTVVASLILWDATQNSAGKADWPHWFADGGYFLFSVMIGDALLMNAIEYFRPFDMLIPRYIRGPKVVTQQRLNRLYSLPSFSLGMRFQFVLKSATIALLFGSALPILYFVSAATLLLTYAIDKYLVSGGLQSQRARHVHFVLMHLDFWTRFCASMSDRLLTTTVWPRWHPLSFCLFVFLRIVLLACTFQFLFFKIQRQTFKSFCCCRA